MNFNTDVNSDLIFLEKDIQISNTIIGKGAFGEVRVARWRNIDVAAKRLHSLVIDKEAAQVDGSIEIDENNCAVVDSFHTEMETLAKLRHPNLVLFLGIVCNVKTRQPTTILTELMPGSLYDVLEVHKTELSLPEILDIAIDVCSGLEYLHSHDPQIVHRDISSKNILIGGNQAKIADLGQAKLFGSALSRQTSMPGAMAYSAPEVLTGRYTAKIDMFSFGILLSQMCTGEYPRIDRREEQLKAACDKYPPLQGFLTDLVAFQPSDRPTSAILCEGLKEIRHNDRFYPPIRRLSPQCDVGVMARRYLDDTVQQRCFDIKLALEQTARRLASEEDRWRQEAAKVDGIQALADDQTAQLIACQDALSRQKAEYSELEDKLNTADSRVYELEEANDVLKADKSELEAEGKQLKSSQAELQSKFDELRNSHNEATAQNETVEERVNIAKDEATFAMKREKNLKNQNNLQAEEIKELEERLEQALTRWKQEKALVVSEGERCARLRDNCADMLEKLAKSTTEIERLTRRLHLYDTLPMPDEIKARFRDYEEDARRNKDEIEDLTKQKKDLREELHKAEVSCKETQNSLDECETERARLEQEGKEKSDQIVELGEALAALGSRFDSSQELVEMLEGEKQNLLDISDELRKKATEKDEELAAMRAARRKERKKMKDGGTGTGTSKKSAGSESFNGEGGDDDVSAVSRATDDVGEDSYEDDDFFETDPEKEAKLKEFDEKVLAAKKVNNEKRKVVKKASSLPQFGSGSTNGIMALIRAASVTKENADIMADNSSGNSKNDLLERKRKMDADAKVRVQQACEHGGATNVIKVVYENMHCENTCWRGVRAIRDLFVKNEEVKEQCLGAKGHELMIAVLTAFPKSGITQAQCLRGLAAFCFGNDMIRRYCGESGVMKRIVIALETHSDDPSVVHHACTALTNLTHNNVDNRMRFQEAGGVEAVVYAIGQHWKDSVKITRQACWAMLTLAGTDAISIDIVEHGGAKIIAEAMIYHSSDAGVQQFGSWAISNLSLANDEIRMQIRNLGVIEVCRIALETHSEDMEVVRQCRHALGVLGPDTDTAAKRIGMGPTNASGQRPNTSGNKTTKLMSVASSSPQKGKHQKRTPGKKQQKK
eukprot:CAMPEP_0114425158 /NCGR_PEP_ID=MMETSP0103-20121206/7086_1 /TAXON_ID=37642 ORGANISM="Paraphysomonas imperforata, Strain PA2" /NCGR_SAMPLE_ID=MMETSP0103 /ASSEMBLY_ACC=CAM_ASM_000201 /LENGTH=1121 /DNA_ID=CAMNT_0001593975 /DNA_START=46 /DNA_END=3411 /DNA_ORIENTATION=-